MSSDAAGRADRATALESVEVEKGGLGVLHGSDAHGGVIENHLKRGRPGRTTASV